MTAVKWVVFGGLVLWMVWAGFLRRRPGLFTWPMFSRVSTCRMELYDDAGRPINQWEHIVHQDPGMNGWELGCYLAYLREVREISANGTVTVVDHVGEQVLTVRDGRVAG